MEIKIHIANLPQVQAALRRSPQIVSKHINKAIKLSIMDLRNSAGEKTPVDTGRLRGSYQVKFGTLRGELQPTANYAYFVHEGHRQQVGRYVPAIGKRLVKSFVKGNPFLKNAVSETERKINERFDMGLKDALNEIAASV